MKKLIIIIILLTIISVLLPISYSKYHSSFKSTIKLNNRKPNYIIKFNSNTGTGTMQDMYLTYGISANLNPNTYEKTGYIFSGWNTKSDGSGKNYQDKELVTNLTDIDNDTIELYAQWENNYIYFQMPPDWNSNNVFVYLYNDYNKIYNAPWPGKAATLIDNQKKIYAYEVESENINKYKNIIFTDTTNSNINAKKQTIDLKFSQNNLGKIFAPTLYSEPNKKRIYIFIDPSQGPSIYLWKRINSSDYTDMSWNNPYYINKKISGYGYEYIIDNQKYNMFKLIWNQTITDDISVPYYQDLTYKINGNMSHQVSRYYYDGIWYEYTNWINNQYNIWKNNEYIKFIQVSSY